MTNRENTPQFPEKEMTAFPVFSIGCVATFTQRHIEAHVTDREEMKQSMDDLLVNRISMLTSRTQG